MCPYEGTLSLSQLQGAHFTACHSYRALLTACRSLSQPVIAYHIVSQPLTRIGLSHPVFQRRPSTNYMCAQDVPTTHIATNMENIKNNALLYIGT